jgi:hypothetical protein
MSDLPSFLPPSAVTGRVLDTSALVRLALGRSLYMQAFARHSTAIGLIWAIPTTAVAEAWAQLPAKGRLALSVLLQLGQTTIEQLEVSQAGAVGEILEGAGPHIDVCAAHVIEVAARRGWPVLTNRGVVLRSVVAVEIEPLP